MQQKTIARVLILGAIAGMRTMSAPALVSNFLQQYKPQAIQDSPLRFLGNKRVGMALKFMAAGELAADKLPDIPNRTEPPALIGRTLSGALSGAALGAAADESPATTAALGAAAAIASTFLMFQLRRAAGEKLNLPDPLLAVLEDTLAIGMGSRALAIQSPLQPNLFT